LNNYEILLNIQNMIHLRNLKIPQGINNFYHLIPYPSIGVMGYDKEILNLAKLF
jgi:hypothetical protein